MKIKKTLEVRQSEVFSALSYALDITEGQAEGHSVRSCFIGMNLARQLNFNDQQLSALFYALLLKDLGCSSNSAKLSYIFGADDQKAKFRLKTVDWSNFVNSVKYVLQTAGEGKSIFQRLTRVISIAFARQNVSQELIKIRCERGSEIASLLNFPEETANAILHLDEHWDGKGHPMGLKGEEISIEGRILGFSQTVEVFFQEGGRKIAEWIVQTRSGSWFDPLLCDLFLKELANKDEFWERLSDPNLIEDIGNFEPSDSKMMADEDRLDAIAIAFARVIDAKSPFTAEHSERVAKIVLGMAGQLKMDSLDTRELFRAALLHDIGKLGVSNLILDKRGKLTDAEWEKMKAHTGYTYSILKRVNGLSQMAAMAAAHHERIDGSGYHLKVSGEKIGLATRLLSVADQFEALTAERPYRSALSTKEALKILEDQIGSGIDESAYKALGQYINKLALNDDLIRN